MMMNITNNTVLEGTSFYFIGIRGVGMTALALILKSMGKKVEGSDIHTDQATPMHEMMNKHHISVLETFDPDVITPAIDVVVVATSFSQVTNPQLKKAQELGILVVTFGDIVAQLFDNAEHSIAISGTHGKTTTSALFAHCLYALKKPAGYFVGGFTSELDNGGYTGREYFVAESDEYIIQPGIDMRPKFAQYDPETIICTTLDYDHPDAYESHEAVISVFKDFFEKVAKKEKGRLIHYDSDKVLVKTAEDIVPANRRITYGFLPESTVFAQNIDQQPDGTFFDVVCFGVVLPNWNIKLQGKHNVANVLSVIAAGHLYGWDMDDLKIAVSTFTGAVRRMQLIAKGKTTILFDDYAHHHTEIAAVIDAMRSTYPDRRIGIVFQPHTYSRTSKFLPEMAEVLSRADRSFVIDIYGSAREKHLEGTVTSRDIEASARNLGKDTVVYVPKEQAVEEIKKWIGPRDIFITMGAGDDVYFMRKELMKVVEKV